MNCESAVKQLPLAVYGELTFDQEEGVQQHLDGCPSCREEMRRLRAMLRSMDAGEIEVESALLVQNRRELRAQVAAIGPEALKGKRAWLSGFFWLKPVAALALLSIGFFGGRYLTREDTPAFKVRNSEPFAARVRYLEPNAEGRIQIVVEETRQRTLSGDMGDESIRRLLLIAARDANDPGLRVESMDLLKDRPESVEVRRLLLQALEHDTNAGVRLKALEGLRLMAGDPEIRKTLARVVLNDDNPGVRTQAIDLLIQRKEPAMIGTLQELMQREDNNYIRLRCKKALADMNASVETF